MSIFNEVFTAEQQFKIHKQNLSLSLKMIWDFKNHSYKAKFMKAQQVHLESHHQMQTFNEIDQKHAKEQQILHYMWVFVYKTDKHDYLQKYKTRLVIYENQQTHEDLFIRVTTLASMTFQMLMSITAKFNLKTIQINIVNTFMNCQLNEIIYMR